MGEALMPPPPHNLRFKKSPCQIGLNDTRDLSSTLVISYQSFFTFLESDIFDLLAQIWPESL